MSIAPPHARLILAALAAALVLALALDVMYPLAPAALLGIALLAERTFRM